MSAAPSPARVWAVIEDLELDVGSSATIRDFADRASAGQLGRLIGEIRRNIAYQQSPGLRNRSWNAIHALERGLEARRGETRRAAAASRAARAAATGAETCNCGEVHPPRASFYVTARDAGRTSTLMLSGPYRTHAEALARVETARALAQELDPRMAFAAFGTVAMPGSYKKRGVLDR